LYFLATFSDVIPAMLERARKSGVWGGGTHWDETVCGLFVIVDGLADFAEHAGSVPLAHAFHTSADTDVNHARLNFVGNLDDRHETRGTLSVDSVEGCGVGDSGDEGGRACDGGTTAGRADCADGDVFDESRVDARRLDDSL
jgi:hypothetical protein